MRSAFRALLWGAALTLALTAQNVPDSPGPAVGTRVPDFTLTDQNGQTHSLKDLYGPKGLMLVFFRSADW